MRFKNHINLQILAFLVLVCAIEFDWIPSKRGGFFCNDPKISHKYNGDTITTKLLIIISFAIPFVCFYICEIFVYIRLYNSHLNSSNNNKNNYLTRSNNYLKSILINKCGKQTLLQYREYVIGLIFLMLIVEIGKSVFGEPRPHFLDTCQPDKAVNCTNSNQYINDYKCTNVEFNSHIVRDSYKSFPSGHAAFSAYTGLFLMWYLHNRFIHIFSSSCLLKPLLQFVCFAWMFVTPLSRVTDSRHHWWDALAGTILGILFTFYTVHVLSNYFMNRSYNDKELITNNSTNNHTTITSDNQFNQMLHNNHIYQHHSSIKRLLSTNSTASSINFKNNGDQYHQQTDKELTDINTYQ